MFLLKITEIHANQYVYNHPLLYIDMLSVLRRLLHGCWFYCLNYVTGIKCNFTCTFPCLLLNFIGDGGYTITAWYGSANHKLGGLNRYILCDFHPNCNIWGQILTERGPLIVKTKLFNDF